MLYLLLVFLSIPVVAYQLIPYIHGNQSNKRKSIIIMVLGDLGHSPRMCYHARSFSDQGYEVKLCGYLEDAPPSDIVDNHRIDITEIPVIKNWGLPFVVFAAYKVLYQHYLIWSMLWSLRGCGYLLIQNPPTIPVLGIAVFYKYVTGTKLVVDWHNLGWTILKIKLGPSHPFVRVAKLYEQLLARFSSFNLTVTKAMKEYLDLPNTFVLYDRPARQFRPCTDRQLIFEKFPEVFDCVTKSTKILITSTSFTPDEDLHMLVSALEIYDRTAQRESDLPPILLLVTGKGPMKQQFLDGVAKHSFVKINVKCLWLAAEDYPKIVSAADMGVSLHSSSSGLDLPMKVLDMFGCGLPVLALNFPCLGELVQNQVNGVVFNDYRSLYEALIFVLKDETLFAKLKKNAMKESARRWEHEWEKSLEFLK